LSVTARKWWHELLHRRHQGRRISLYQRGNLSSREGLIMTQGGQLTAFLCPAIGEHINRVHESFDNLFSNQVSQRKFSTMF